MGTLEQFGKAVLFREGAVTVLREKLAGGKDCIVLIGRIHPVLTEKLAMFAGLEPRTGNPE